MHEISMRLKRAELASGLGAGVLGAGLGVLLSGWLLSYALPLVAIGGFVHGWGMWDKRRLEQSEALDAQPAVWWSTLLYWICWATLLVLAVIIVLRR